MLRLLRNPHNPNYALPSVLPYAGVLMISDFDRFSLLQLLDTNFALKECANYAQIKKGPKLIRLKPFICKWTH